MIQNNINISNNYNLLSVIILTKNEEKNIEKCIQSAQQLTDQIFIVDSGSSDNTVAIAEKLGARVVSHEWTNYSEQLNWGLDNIDFGTEWIMRLDADEEITSELAQALRTVIPDLPNSVAGISVRRQVHFMGRWIRHGGFYPTWLLRIFRCGIGRCEALWMDEHIVLSQGETIRIHQDIIDKNNKDLTFWVNKHNGYASREVVDLLSVDLQTGDDKYTGQRYCLSKSTTDLPDTQVRARRWIKKNVYSRLPLFFRPSLYFFYRYFIRLGFLDGKEGLIFHFLQGFWYRFLVDAKLYEERKRRSEAHCE